MNRQCYWGIQMDALFLILLLWCSISDMRKRAISNILIVAMLCLGLTHTVIASLTGSVWWPYPAGLLLSVPFFIVWFRNGMGAGDVKLFAAVGLYLGLLNTLAAFMLMIPIFVIFLVWSLLKHKTLKRRIPLAPVITAGVAGVIALSYLLRFAYH